jgi:hypothetical protein
LSRGIQPALPFGRVGSRTLTHSLLREIAASRTSSVCGCPDHAVSAAIGRAPRGDANRGRAKVDVTILAIVDPCVRDGCIAAGALDADAATSVSATARAP